MRAGRIVTREEKMNRHARCDTCAFEGLPVVPPFGPDKAARVHLRQNPDHEVSLSYVVEVAYFWEEP